MANTDPLGWDELFDERTLSFDSVQLLAATTKALAARAEIIAEVGCGRGALVRSDNREAWQDLRGPARKVIGIDIDPAGTENPVVDEFRLIGPDGRWPLEDESVDLAVSDYVLEHVQDPASFVAELTRVLRPGGVFVARTINRHSILATAARVVPNRSHTKVLRVVQPRRQEKDVFATAYQMNTRKALAALLDDRYEWAAASRGGLERYFQRFSRLRRTIDAVERRLPRSMQTSLVLVARKRGVLSS